MVKDAARSDVADARFVVSRIHREGKGSDVNVAPHLPSPLRNSRRRGDRRLQRQQPHAADAEARHRVPVGLITPSGGRLTGDLAFNPKQGTGRH
jgi:hypothetical protein